MGLTKSDIFTKEQNHLAQMAKVLAHPARIAILQHIIKVNQCICGDLVNEIGLAQSKATIPSSFTFVFVNENLLKINLIKLSVRQL